MASKDLRRRLCAVKYNDTPGLFGSLAANIHSDAFDNILAFIETELSNAPQPVSELCYNCGYSMFLYQGSHRCIECGAISTPNQILEGAQR